MALIITDFIGVADYVILQKLKRPTANARIQNRLKPYVWRVWQPGEEEKKRGLVALHKSVAEGWPPLGHAIKNEGQVKIIGPAGYARLFGISRQMATEVLERDETLQPFIHRINQGRNPIMFLHEAKKYVLKKQGRPILYST